ncbi:hypothetical protein ACG04Q_21550 [Roseateles sp. DXS20W]|uniref:Site-specific integrase n=1 Tax=Pelomonas lactea TaxID=3299030 RepID=A0ABW7GQS9_9BURK
MSPVKASERPIDGSRSSRPPKGEHRPFAFDELGLSGELASALGSAHLASFGHTAWSSQTMAWRCVRKLAAFLHARGYALKVPLPSTVATEFRDWLGSLGHAATTCQSVLNRILAIFGWIERNAPALLAPGTRIKVLGFRVEPSPPREALSEEAVKRILECCYADIEATEASLTLGQRLLARTPLTSEESERCDLIAELLAMAGGGMPSQRAVHAAGGNLSRRVGVAGGLRGLSRQIWMCPEAMVPFYVAIVVQTSGNPQSILTMSRNCIAAHPLRTDLERVVWEKPRSGKEQHAEAPVGRKWSAPSLIRRLLALNANLLPATPPQHRERLFLAYPLVGKSPAIPSSSLLHILVNEFAERHGLPRFQLRDFRAASADAHHRAGGSMRIAQKRLNHESVATTMRYTRLDMRQAEHESRIRHFQGLLVRESMQPRADAPKGSARSGPVKNPAETVFGFRCGDPFGGIAQGSRSGELCLQFQRCATCPGAIIPLDNPQVVARLLAAFDALAEGRQRALAEGWQARYEMLYEPTRVILAEDILPAVSKAVRGRAEQLVKGRQIPHLE